MDLLEFLLVIFRSLEGLIDELLAAGLPVNVTDPGRDWPLFLVQMLVAAGTIGAVLVALFLGRRQHHAEQARHHEEIETIRRQHREQLAATLAPLVRVEAGGEVPRQAGRFASLQIAGVSDPMPLGLRNIGVGPATDVKVMFWVQEGDHLEGVGREATPMPDDLEVALGEPEAFAGTGAMAPGEVHPFAWFRIPLRDVPLNSTVYWRTTFRDNFERELSMTGRIAVVDEN